LDKSVTILFVCTGNTCRSSMAETIAKNKLDQLALNGVRVEIISAGTHACKGMPASRQAIQVMKERGLDLSHHQARQVTPELIEKADFIFTMTKGQKQFVLSLCPNAVDKIAVLDIADPFGGSLDIYRYCAYELEKALDTRIADVLKADNNGGGHLKIALGCDHGGLKLKEIVKEFFVQGNYHFDDFGTFNEESVDYPDFAEKVAEAVASGAYDRGILICGTGIGIGIAANKVPGIRAALCHDVFSARASREHNDANVLTMGERVIGPGLALEIVKTWLTTDFAGGRHARRVEKIKKLEEKHLRDQDK
jgi:ribose 5-phosphate isomerase B